MYIVSSFGSLKVGVEYGTGKKHPHQSVLSVNNLRGARRTPGQQHLIKWCPPRSKASVCLRSGWGVPKRDLRKQFTARPQAHGNIFRAVESQAGKSKQGWRILIVPAPSRRLLTAREVGVTPRPDDVRVETTRSTPNRGRTKAAMMRVNDAAAGSSR